MVKKYTPAKQNVKSFKLTTSLFPVWGPKTKMLGKILVRLLLKNTFLFFLGHLAFVLLQSSFQMLIFFFSPVSQTGNKNNFSSWRAEQHSPLAPHSKPQREWAFGASGRLRLPTRYPSTEVSANFSAPQQAAEPRPRPHCPLTAFPARPGP